MIDNFCFVVLILLRFWMMVNRVDMFWFLMLWMMSFFRGLILCLVERIRMMKLVIWVVFKYVVRFLVIGKYCSFCLNLVMGIWKYFFLILVLVFMFLFRVLMVVIVLLFIYRGIMVILCGVLFLLVKIEVFLVCFLVFFCCFCFVWFFWLSLDMVCWWIVLCCLGLILFVGLEMLVNGLIVVN